MPGLLPVMSVESVTTWSRPDPNARNLAVEGPCSASYRDGANPTSVERPILSRFGVTESCMAPAERTEEGVTGRRRKVEMQGRARVLDPRVMGV